MVSGTSGVGAFMNGDSAFSKRLEFFRGQRHLLSYAKRTSNRGNLKGSGIRKLAAKNKQAFLKTPVGAGGLNLEIRRKLAQKVVASTKGILSVNKTAKFVSRLKMLHGDFSSSLHAIANREVDLGGTAVTFGKGSTINVSA